MGIRESRDELGTEFAGLQTYDTGALKAEHIRARCLVALEAARCRRLGYRARIAAWKSWFEPAVAFALGALYLAAAIGSSLHLYR